MPGKQSDAFAKARRRAEIYSAFTDALINSGHQSFGEWARAAGYPVGQTGTFTRVARGDRIPNAELAIEIAKAGKTTVEALWGPSKANQAEPEAKPD